MYKVLSGLAVVAVWVLTATALARADDADAVPLDKLPSAVTDALKKKFPDAELVEAEKSKEDGKVHYKVTIKFKKQELDVTLTPAGKITEVEKEIEVKDAPKAVLDAVEKKYPKSTVQGASEISKNDKVAEYEFDIVTKDKKNLYVTFGKSGKFIYEEEVKPETPKDKKDGAKEKKDK